MLMASVFLLVLCGAGGLIRDCHGNWITGFSANVGKIGIVAAALFAIRQRLLICSELGFHTVWCESDSKEVVRLCLLQDIPLHHRHAAIIANNHCLLRQNWTCNIAHVFRAGNACADLLAKASVSQTENFIRWKSPPSLLSSALLADSFGVTFLR
ncbi:Ribonuclease H-like superfamily [Sesbania bispinosa]|nr:Ribonuclease H-like superfamily [Sesbania bispinosa]